MTDAILRVESRSAVIRVSVHVQPGASQSEIVGAHGSALKVRVHAPPVGGAANAQVERLLAERLGAPRRAVTVVAGWTSRAKTVDIGGTTVAAVRALVATHPQTS